ncbi:glutamate mutase L [Oligoflexia bacterium]|nr:glutamate mutase L [Oligoflexia bacterium]
MKTNKDQLNTVLVTDCGSTTTKALMFQKTADGWRQTCRGEAPTTVEAPVADVTVGALNAFTEIQELSQRELLKPEAAASESHPFICTNGDPSQGTDLYLSTSSAGGGLQMMVTGVVEQMTTESAQRAALGAGAIVMDSISGDDAREDHERIERIRHLRPDIVLITGGVDSGSRVHVVEMAEILLAAAPRPRFGDTLRLPVIYAGNSEAAEEVSDILSKIAQVSIVENVRPSLDVENLTPAREAIHEFFLTHVMSHSPGYGKLLNWTPIPVMPTPAAVGDMVLRYAESCKRQVLCADIGGATTDVFSVFNDAEDKPIFNRTVSANLGMSYSVANVLIESGVQNIARWLPYTIHESEVRDRLRNKMIRPTSIPQTKDDLWLEQAVCREALRLSLEHHRSLAVGLSGVQKQRGIAEIFSQQESRYELVDMMKLDIVIGSGGVLSHAPDRLGAALMMLDGFGLQGLTQIAVDSIFMMPHLGVFSSVHPEAAEEIFLRDCLVNIGHAVVPVYSPKNVQSTLVEVFVNGERVGEVLRGEVGIVEVASAIEVELKLVPKGGDIDIGAGKGDTLVKEIETGSCGIILDGRNRPIVQPETEAERVAVQQTIFSNLGLK